MQLKYLRALHSVVVLTTEFRGQTQVSYIKMLFTLSIKTLSPAVLEFIK